MKRAEREFRSALVQFNRSAGQIKRWHPSLDPKEYLQNVHTAKGVEKALGKLKFDAEQIDIAVRVEAYERKLDRIYEEQLKEENYEQFLDQRDRARKTLNDEYGLDWDDDEYEDFWDIFGDDELIDTYGSDQIITNIGYDYMNEGSPLSPAKVGKIARKTMKEIKKIENTKKKKMNHRKAVDLLKKNLDAEIRRRKKRGK